MRISDWSSDVCSSDLAEVQRLGDVRHRPHHRGVSVHETLMSTVLPDEELPDFAPGDPDGSKAQRSAVHEKEVEAEMWRIEIREDAKGRIRAKRDAYLTSDEGRAEAAARFEEPIIDLADLPDPEPLIEGFLHRPRSAEEH